MDLLRIKLILPISVNNMYKAGRNGRRYMGKAARSWQEYAVYSIRDIQTKDNAAIQAAREHKTPLVLYLDAKMPAKRILGRDSDNMVKLTQDTVMMALWPSDASYDDRFVYDVHITKRPSANGESALYVALTTLEDDEELRDVTRTPQSRVKHRTLAQPGTPTAQSRARSKKDTQNTCSSSGQARYNGANTTHTDKA